MTSTTINVRVQLTIPPELVEMGLKRGYSLKKIKKAYRDDILYTQESYERRDMNNIYEYCESILNQFIDE